MPPDAQILLVILVAVVLGFMLSLVLAKRHQRKIQRLREAGMFPQKGQETDSDVDRLLQHGYKNEAITVYRFVHRVGLKEAKEAVDKRQRELFLG